MLCGEIMGSIAAMPNPKLSGKGLLTPLQNRFIYLFSKLEDQNQFYLTGGTALAEYYLGHRLSYDLDFFTGVDGLVLPISYQIERLSGVDNLKIIVVRRFATYVEFLISNSQDSLKVDLALDSPFRFEPPLLSLSGIYTNDYQDLRIDKLLAFFGRAEPRDAVDLFFILKNEPLKALLVQAAQKDPGFDLYWFAIALKRSIDLPDEPERWPVKMLIPFDPKELKQLFQLTAMEILENIK